MNWYSTGAAIALVMGGAHAALAQSDAEMMTKCNSYAAHHLHISPSNVTDIVYEGQRNDGTYAVVGSTSSGQNFECTFGKAGRKVVAWSHTAPTGCPADVSEADRYRYPDCD